ncbi:hypothetical protein [Azohydromonas caseinilytica]|uniref:Uncharacterized protein n=1 Tax=Azohydromonas caseinilytica TaxID=2728836 RepID=A0A848FCK1_9BURK|nr:hypothetical protein [Azohydromonas caseinilytica]NML17947.1 hypothetical protein [Azohydromonas caseinilytica]
MKALLFWALVSAKWNPCEQNRVQSIPLLTQPGEARTRNKVSLQCSGAVEASIAQARSLRLIGVIIAFSMMHGEFSRMGQTRLPV